MNAAAMKRRILHVILILVMGCGAALTAPVTGSGESSRGGTGGRTLLVTRLDDDPRQPRVGSLRWALQQKGPRIVNFSVSGNITLLDSIMVREPFLTLDGTNAPAGGVCIRGGSLMFENTHDILVRQIRIRLGEEPARRQRRGQRTMRPKHSAGLDCVSLKDSRRIVFDHCSLSWSCDEIFGIVRCRDVTIQWCILSEPLGNPRLHPYGDDHAYPINASASTLCVHHCLLAHFVMRGPQFEANDMRRQDRHAVKMEAVNNVIFDYQHSGSRYSCGVEKKNGVVNGKSFQFQFLNNLYLSNSALLPPIECITEHGVIPNVRVHASGNVLLAPKKMRQSVSVTTRLFAPGKGPVLPAPDVSQYRETSPEHRSEVNGPLCKSDECPDAVRSQISKKLLFITPANSVMEPAQTAAERVLHDAGCSMHRDDVDGRIVNDVIRRRYGRVLSAAPWK